MPDHLHHTISYTAEDFARYYAGTMTAQEMHQLEKSALDDPFLQDALDGYRHTKNGVMDVDALKQQIKVNAEKETVISLSQRRSMGQLWKVAAMVLLTAGMGWLIYNFSFNQKSSNIAAADERSYKSTPSTDSAPTAVSAIQDSVVATPPADLTSTAAPATTPALPRAKSGRPGQEQMKQIEDAESSASVESNTAGKDDGQARAFLQQESTPANAASKLADSAVIVGYGTQKKARLDNTNTIVLEKAKEREMQEVVVGRSTSDSSSRKPRIYFEEAVPKNGTIYYSDYVAQNIQEPLKETMKRPGGEVQLSFDVNRNGQAINIKVEKSLCKACDDEAVRLLKEGPGWIQKKKTKKGKLSIRF